MTEKDIIAKIKGLRLIEPSLSFEKGLKNRLLATFPEERGFTRITTRIYADLFSFKLKKPAFALALFFLIIFTSLFLVNATNQSLPNQKFYLLKIGLEKMSLLVANPQKKAELKLNYTLKRLEELTKASEKEKIIGVENFKEEFNGAKEEIRKLVEKQEPKKLKEVTFDTGELPVLDDLKIKKFEKVLAEAREELLKKNYSLALEKIEGLKEEPTTDNLQPTTDNQQLEEKKEISKPKIQKPRIEEEKIEESPKSEVPNSKSEPNNFFGGMLKEKEGEFKVDLIKNR